MAQYQARTGPITNAAAPFVPSMVQADRPVSPFRFSSRQSQGWSVSQTTHVSAPFVPAMVEASRPTQSRAWIAPLLNRAGWVTAPLDVTRFIDEALFTTFPLVPRAQLGPKIPQPWSQTTHVAAAITVDMLIGARPDQSRQGKVQVGGTWLTPDVQSFSIEMAQGWHPDRNRQFLAPRLLFPLSQTSHTSAPVTTDMLAGAHPDQSRQGKLQRGQTWWPPDLDVFSIEMVVGAHPDRARFFSGPRTVGWQVAQTTPQAAVFSVEMIQGSVPPRGRLVSVRQPTGPNPIDVIVPSFLAQWARNSNQYLSQPIDLLLEIQETQEGPFLSAVFLSTVFFTNDDET